GIGRVHVTRVQPCALPISLNALTYIGIIGVLARWRRPPDERLLPREGIGTAMRAGVRYVAMSPNIKHTLFRAVVFGLGASGLMRSQERRGGQGAGGGGGAE